MAIADLYNDGSGLNDIVCTGRFRHIDRTSDLFIFRVVHATRIRAVSPGADNFVYLDARKRRSQSHRLGSGCVCHASSAGFSTHGSLEKLSRPREMEAQFKFAALPSYQSLGEFWGQPYARSCVITLPRHLHCVFCAPSGSLTYHITVGYNYDHSQDYHFYLRVSFFPQVSRAHT
jgi:hypothetical protein